jgi:hypothetical protein
MENKKKKKVVLDPVLLKGLWSKDDTTVLKTLKKLRLTGNIGYIPELLNLLKQSGSEQIRKEIVQFVADVKNPAVIPFILSALNNPDFAGAWGYIVSACWQSGLDYSRDLFLFVRLFMEGDYATALEAFTVIEEEIVDLVPDKISQLHKQVESEMDKVNEEKKPLALELLKLLRN